MACQYAEDLLSSDNFIVCLSGNLLEFTNLPATVFQSILLDGLILSILLTDTMGIHIKVSHSTFSITFVVCMFLVWYSQYVRIGTRSL